MPESGKKVVLAVDDEEFNLDIIEEYLMTVDIDAVRADNGDQALSILHNHPQRFSAVLLDRTMPGIDGLDVLSTIKADVGLSHIPVIMQTGRATRDDMLEGLNAGAHYYVCKPYDRQTLVEIVSAAIRDFEQYTDVQDNLERAVETLKMMDRGVFYYSTLDEGRNLAAIMAKACPDPDAVVFGLTELMVNAVEHGNLGIGYDEKSRLNADNEWENEVTRRLSQSSNRDKYVTITFERNDEGISFLIEDQGDGFDWEQYMEMSPARVFDTHGRGIAMARMLSFDKIEYLGKGNRVSVTIAK